MGVFLVYYLVKYLWNRRKNRNNTNNEGKKVLEINVGEAEDELSTLYVFRGYVDHKGFLKCIVYQVWQSVKKQATELSEVLNCP